MSIKRNLEGPIIDKGENTEYLICFLHGWGSDGNDLIQIGEMWTSKLPNITLISPNGPEVCAGNPNGRQWFDILSNNQEETLNGLNQSYIDLKSYLKIYLEKYKLSSDKFFLVGFSQGTMLALYTSLREKLSGVVGYSGAFLGNIPNDKVEKNDYLLLHGKKDNVVPIEKMHKAIESLQKISNFLDSKIYNDLEHSINEEGLLEGLNFIKERIKI